MNMYVKKTATGTDKKRSVKEIKNIKYAPPLALLAELGRLFLQRSVSDILFGIVPPFPFKFFSSWSNGRYSPLYSSSSYLLATCGEKNDIHSALSLKFNSLLEKKNYMYVGYDLVSINLTFTYCSLALSSQGQQPNVLTLQFVRTLKIIIWQCRPYQ